MLRIRPVRAASLLLVVLLLAGCSGTSPEPASEAAPSPLADVPQALRDASSDWNVEFVHEAGRFDEFEMPSIMGSGAAVVDYDRDGRLDLYLVNGRPADVPAAASVDDRHDSLLRQRRPGGFEEVSASLRSRCGEFGMGAWWGDYDQDGFADLLLTNVGPNRLYRNLGDGTLLEVPLPEDAGGNAWSTAACWSDLDSDGDLDLFVANYVDYLPGQYCDGSDGNREFCGPDAYQGTVDRLLINTGRHAADGTSSFVDETVARGIGDVRGKGLGVIAGDFDGDGRIDVYVANDMEANRMWLQRSDGTFEDRADLAGTARNFLGQAEASMGVVTGDWNADGMPDLFMAHLSGETNTLYLSSGAGVWEDATARSKLGPPSLPATGFGIAAIDLEHDGDVDFLLANGGVKRESSQSACDPPLNCYAQHNAVYLSEPTLAQFADAAPQYALFAEPFEVSRALAEGDFDNDGDRDLLLTNCAGPARVYENLVPPGRNWLAVRLVDPLGNRDAVGASITLSLAGGGTLTRQVNPYQGYLSQNQLAVHFGLADANRYASLEVRWPDGTVESFAGSEANQYRTIVRVPPAVERGAGPSHQKPAEDEGEES